MRVAVVENNKILFKDAECPKVSENDVLIKNLYSGITVGDNTINKAVSVELDEKVDSSFLYNHNVARVVEVGENVMDFNVNDIVFPYPVHAFSDENGIDCLSEYVLIKNAKKDHSLFLIDDSINPVIATLILPFAYGSRAARRGMKILPFALNLSDDDIEGDVRYLPGENAIVFGSNTLGIAAAMSLLHFGMKKVVICDYHNNRLEMAKKLGFNVLDLNDSSFLDRLNSYYGSAYSLFGETANIDCWIDAIGDDIVLEQFIALGKLDCRFVSAASTDHIRNLDLLHLTKANQSIIGSSGYRHEDIVDVIKMFNENNSLLEHLITRRSSIEKLEGIELDSSLLDNNEIFNDLQYNILIEF